MTAVWELRNRGPSVTRFGGDAAITTGWGSEGKRGGSYAQGVGGGGAACLVPGRRSVRGGLIGGGLIAGARVCFSQRAVGGH